MNALLSFLVCVFLMGFAAIPPVPATPPPPPVPATPPPVFTTPPPPLTTALEPLTKGETVGPFGVHTNGDPFDDGVFEGVRTITVYYDSIGLTGIKIQYVANEKFHLREHGDISTQVVGFEVAYPEEFITAISGRYSHDVKLNTSFVSAIAFVTSYGTITPFFGPTTEDSTLFVLEAQQGKVKRLIGFLGTSGGRISSLGAHFGSAFSASKRRSQRSEKVAGISRQISFDDGVFDGVRTVTVRGDSTCISYIRMQYVDGDMFQTREHGSYTNNEGAEVVFKVEYPEEYITAVVVAWTITTDNTQVLGINIITSYTRYTELGTFPNDSLRYELEPKAGVGPKLVGFVGQSGTSINAIGARFLSSSVFKTEPSLLVTVCVLFVVMCLI